MKKSSMAAREKWSGIIQEQRASGASIAGFCAERAIPASSFFSWRRRLSGAAGAGVVEAVTSPTTRFVEAKIDGVRGVAHALDGGVAVELAGGRLVKVVRGFDRLLLLDVIAALESDACSAAVAHTRGRPMGRHANEALP